MHSFVRRGLAATILLASSTSLSTAALASESAGIQEQTSAGTGASDEDAEIVVSARHRQESAQAVPLAIAVVGGDHIDNTGAFNVGRLQQLTPTLQFSSSNPRNTSVNIRGFGSPLGLTNDGIDQGVGVYVDDVYYSRAAASTFDFLDVAQVEVLRGPQGTLYGKNTTAGAIAITTRQPSFELEGRAELSTGNLGFFQAKGAISGPLSDSVAVRLAVSETKRSGTIWNLKTNQWDNNLDNTGLRAQVLWRAASTLDVTLAGDFNHQNTVCCATVFVGYVPTQKALARQYGSATGLLSPTGPFASYALPASAQNPYNRETDVDGELRAKQSIGGASLRAKLDLGSNTLTSITAFRFWNWDPSNDRDFTGLAITTKSQNPSKQRQFTQELRFNHHSALLDYQVGSFFYHQSINTDGLQVQGPDATKWLLAPSGLPANPYNLDVLNGLTSVNTIRLRNTSFSVYGQASWRPLPRLTIQPGARINYDKKSGSYDAVVTDRLGTVLTPAMAVSG
ncbi:MAG: hypothetical protein RL404_1973, partial [Pseudomonadota bacterium]